VACLEKNILFQIEIEIKNAKIIDIEFFFKEKYKKGVFKINLDIAIIYL